MTVNLYALNNAVNQGNALNAQTAANNQQITANNNAIDEKIAEAKKSTEEGQGVTTVTDVVKEGLSMKNLNRAAQGYIDSVAGAKAKVQATIDTARQVQKSADTALSAGKTLATDGKTTLASAVDTTKGPAETEGGALAKGALGKIGLGEKAASGIMKGAGLIGSAVTIGTDVEADMNGQFKDMNFEQQVGNVGGIVGSALDIIGTVVPGAQLLAVAGMGISALSGAIGGVGDIESEKDAGQSQVTQLEQSKEQLQQVQSNAGKAPIAVS